MLRRQSSKVGRKAIQLEERPAPGLTIATASFQGVAARCGQSVLGLPLTIETSGRAGRPCAGTTSHHCRSARQCSPPAQPQDWPCASDEGRALWTSWCILGSASIRVTRDRRIYVVGAGKPLTLAASLGAIINSGSLCRRRTTNPFFISLTSQSEAVARPLAFVGHTSPCYLRCV